MAKASVIKSVRVGSLDIVVERERLYDDASGCWSMAPNPVIKIDDRLEGRDEYSAIFHEAIHAISDLFKMGFSEKTVRILEMVIGSFLRDNPEVVKGLLSKKRK